MNELRKVVILILFFFITVSAYSQEQFSFRGVPWGSSVQEFIQQEGEPAEQLNSQQVNMFGDYILRYYDKQVAGYQADFEAEFSESGLSSGSYYFTLERKTLFTGYENPKSFFDAYIDLQNKVTSLYGDATNRDEVERIEGEISSLMAAKYSDNAPYNTLWNVGDGAVMLMMRFAEKWSLLLMYLSPEMYQEIKSIQQEKASSTDGL